jgi:hypothetical protein
MTPVPRSETSETTVGDSWRRGHTGDTGDPGVPELGYGRMTS